MGRGTTLIKYLLIILNVIFMLGGLTAIVLGAIIQCNIGFYEKFLGNSISTAPIILIVVGSIVFLISFFGCCGAIRESRCMLMSFAACMSLQFVLLLVGAILAFAFIDSLYEVLHKSMKESMNVYTEFEAMKYAWDIMQNVFHCCGTDSYQDWLDPPNPEGPGLTTRPDSCQCVDSEAGCETDVDAYSDGCYDVVAQLIKSLQYTIAGVAVLVASLELIGIVFACCLVRAIKTQRRYLVLTPLT